jgi:hypothetical protein
MDPGERQSSVTPGEQIGECPPPTVYAKCACQNCGTHLEFPTEAAGATINCPHCQQPTVLAVAPPPAAEPEPASGVNSNDLLAAFNGTVPRTPVSLLYRLGLLIVALTMIVLPIVYVGFIAAAGFAVHYWATHFTFLLGGGGGGRLMILKFLAYATPLVIGVVVVFFMIKPLLARRPRAAKPLALNPGAEPLVFVFVAKICEIVGAPHPKRIDVDCQLNASAGFRRGLLSFLGHDLVLTMGLPLVAGLTLRELAGVLAHEFGHFTQGFGMRLTYIIRSVNFWFARVVYERDAWDVWLAEVGEETDWRIAIVVGLARFAVWCSRLILMALMYLGHLIGCFMLRQMEYDADRYEIKLAGSETFESASRRIHVLAQVLGLAYKELRVPWNNNRRLPDNVPAFVLQHDERIRPEQRTRWEDTMGLEATGVFHTHPSHGDRIRRARLAQEPGVFHLDAPASVLFSNFDVLAKQVTLLHYSDDLGLPVGMAKFYSVQLGHTASGLRPTEFR